MITIIFTNSRDRLSDYADAGIHTVGNGSDLASFVALMHEMGSGVFAVSATLTVGWRAPDVPVTVLFDDTYTVATA